MSSVRLPECPRSEPLVASLGNELPMRVTGRVAAVTGGTVELEGMSAPIGAVCRIRTVAGVTCDAKLIGFRGVRPILAPLGEARGLSAGDAVEMVAPSARVKVGPGLAGRVIDALGQPLDGRRLPPSLASAEIDRTAPSSLERPPIDEPLSTGVRAIDAMMTCGRGQRLGIFAGSGVGKSTLLGMLVRGTAADAIVVGMVGERGREVRDFIEESLGEEGLRRTTLVVATSDQPAALRVQAAWTATAIAESLRDEGKNVLLLIDSVTRFAMAQRELGLAAGEPPTTRGYPPSVFGMLPRLVERAGRTERGSITAFYSVLVEGDDQNEPIADTLRGLLDGHIVLSRQLASESHWPAIDVLESLSRLQPRVVDPGVLGAAHTVRRSMAEYRRQADLIAIGAYRAGTHQELDRAVAMRDPIREFLTQASGERFPMVETHAHLLKLAQAAGG